MEVTVVVPTFNRQDALLETLEALARVDYPHDQWEVIIVDDGSTDGSEAAVRQWAQNHPITVRYIRQENAGRSVARNRGVAEAHGEVLIFIDNDIIVEPDFIQAHAQALADNSNCWILGKVMQSPKLCRTPFGRYRNALMESYSAAYANDRLSETDGMTTQNISMPTADFQRLGGFDLDLIGPEDWELAWRARQTGTRVLYAPHIQVLHNDWAVSLDAYCRRERTYCVTQVLLYLKWGEATPWARLIHESAPVRWQADAPRLIVKKGMKWLLATKIGLGLIRGGCWLAERVAPDTNLARKSYEAAIGVAIFQGVRTGFKRYGTPTTTN